jgi:hypothetical protein
MDESNNMPIAGSRPGSFQAHRRSNDSHQSLHSRRGSNVSSTSFMDDVEMAHDEVGSLHSGGVLCQ